MCLTWLEPSGANCSGKAQLGKKVEEVLGHSVFVPEGCDKVMVGSLQKNGEAAPWVARLRIEAPDGTLLGSRELESKNPSCSALTEPVALVVALMIESTKVHASLNIEAQPIPAPRSDAEATPVHLSAALNGTWGVLNTLALGPELGVLFSLNRFVSARVPLAAWFPARSVAGTREGRFWGVQSGAALCAEANRGGVPQIALCAGARAGLLHGTGSGLDYNLSVSRPFAQAELQMLGVVPLSATLGFFLQVGAGMPLVRPRFVYLDADGDHHQVHQPSAVVFSAGAGIEISTAPRRERAGR